MTHVLVFQDISQEVDEEGIPSEACTTTAPLSMGAGHSGTSLDIEKPQPPVWKAVNQS